MFQEKQDRTNSAMNGKTIVTFGIRKRSVFKESRSSPFAVDVTAWPTQALVGDVYICSV